MGYFIVSGAIGAFFVYLGRSQEAFEWCLWGCSLLISGAILDSKKNK